MITNRDAIYQVKGLLEDKTGQRPFAKRVSNRMILKALKDARASVTQTQRLNNSKIEINKFSLQTLRCVSMVEVDKTMDIPCIPRSGNYWTRSKFAIPRVIGNKITSVSSVDGSMIFSFADWDKLKYKRNSRFKSQNNSGYYTLKTEDDGVHIYIEGKEILALAVTGLFSDPYEVRTFPLCDQEPEGVCSPLEEEFVADPELMPLIISQAVKFIIPG